MLVSLREYYIGVYLEQVRVGLQSGMRPGFVRDETDRRAPNLKNKGSGGWDNESTNCAGTEAEAAPRAERSRLRALKSTAGMEDSARKRALD